MQETLRPEPAPTHLYSITLAGRYCRLVVAVGRAETAIARGDAVGNEGDEKGREGGTEDGVHGH